VELLGTAAKTSPPGTETIGKIFQAAGGPVLILFDEVLNFLNRHRNMADSFYAFFDNINRATTGTTHCAAVMSLPRSQMEMTEWDSQWQDKITKVVRRVAKDLIANDETEISEIASQPFVADYIQDSFEQDPRLAALLARATQVVIDNFDGAIKTCINLDRPRNYTVLYARSAHAQKQAQSLWGELVRSRHHDLAKGISFLPLAGAQEAYCKPWDLLYAWIPFSSFEEPRTLRTVVRTVAGAIGQGGVAFIVGPASLQSTFPMQPHLRVLSTEPVETLPTFRMHQTILPKARLKSGLALFHVEKD